MVAVVYVAINIGSKAYAIVQEDFFYPIDLSKTGKTLSFHLQAFPLYQSPYLKQPLFILIVVLVAFRKTAETKACKGWNNKDTR